MIEALDDGLVYGVKDLPEGAVFDPDTHTFTYTPQEAGSFEVTFTVDDGVIPVEKTIIITVTAG